MAGRVESLTLLVGLAAGLVCGCTTLQPHKPSAPRKPVDQTPAEVKGPDVSGPSYPVVPIGDLVQKQLKPNGLAQVKYPGAQPDRLDIHMRSEKLPDATKAPVIIFEPIRPEEQQAEPAAARIEVGPEDPILVALRHLRENKPAEAVKALEKLDKVNQEMLQCLLPIAVRLGDGSLEGAKPQELAALIQQIESLELPLRAMAPLRIDKLCFCKLIRRFGCYEPLREVLPSFQGASEGRDGELVQVYAEISNFTTRSEGIEHLASLESIVEVRNYSGEVVWTYKFPTEPDRSRTARHDYFIYYRFPIPAELKPGHYTMWVQVRDALAKTPRPPARCSLDFRVIAQGSVPGPQGGPGLASKSGGGGS